MIVDTSALIAILLSEPERPVLEDRLAQDPYPRMSAATLLEAGIVVDSRRDPVATRLLDDLIVGSGLTIESVTYEQALIARQAYRDFGRGNCSHQMVEGNAKQVTRTLSLKYLPTIG